MHKGKASCKSQFKKYILSDSSWEYSQFKNKILTIVSYFPPCVSITFILLIWAIRFRPNDKSFELFFANILLEFRLGHQTFSCGNSWIFLVPPENFPDRNMPQPVSFTAFLFKLSFWYPTLKVSINKYQIINKYHKIVTTIFTYSACPHLL